MKKLLFLALMLTSIMMLSAQYQWQLTEPTLLDTPAQVGFSYYDYQNGGYDGYGIRVQPNHVPERGVYMTFMQSTNATESPDSSPSRRQYYGWGTPDGYADVGNRTNPQTSSSAKEGFGSVALDPVTGSAIYVWHQANGSNVSPFFSFDNWTQLEAAGMGFSETAGMILNNNTEWKDFESYQWPVVFVGNSPYPDKRRVYVFLSNGGNYGGVEGASPMSDVMLAFADFDTDTLDTQTTSSDEWVWITKHPPYMQDFLAAFLEMEGGTEADYYGYRMFTTGTVSETSGRVIITAAISGGRLAETQDNYGRPAHDIVVLVDDSYGEFLDGQHKEIFLNLTRVLQDDLEESGNGFVSTEGHLIPSLIVPENDPSNPFEFGAGIDNLTPGTPYPIYGGGNFTQEGNGLYKMTPASTRKTVALANNDTKLIFPIDYSLGMADEGKEGYYFPGVISYVKLSVTIDLNTEGLLTNDNYQIHQFGPKNVGKIDRVPWFFDYDYDMVADPEFVVYQGPSNAVRPGEQWFEFYPTYNPTFWTHEDESGNNGSYFHYNFTRMTYDNDGYIFQIWMDATKGTKFNEDGDDDYAPYESVPELVIVASGDHGENWSNEVRVSTFTHPNLAIGQDRYPTYFYVADKIERIGNTFRLYFMYTADRAYGSTVQNNGANSGTSIRYAVMDFSLTVGEGDEVAIKPTRTLNASNYPNPFNPSTTIKFDMPQAGHASVKIFNVKGQLVNTLVDGLLTAGPQSTTWTGLDMNNKSVSSGIYFYKVESNGVTETKKMILMK